MEGVDYSTSRPAPAQLVAAGKKFVCRYLAYLPNPKVLTDSERKALHAAGLDIVLNWEQAAGDMLNGYAKGRTHASEALRQARVLGAPDNVPIYFSCDVNILSSDNMEKVRQYLLGCTSVLGPDRVGVYGQYSVIETMLPGTCKWGWQTYAWSGGKISTKAHFLQYHNGVNVAGADVDLDKTLQANIGAWSMADADYRPYGPPKAEGYPGIRTPDTILADAAGEILNGHSPWDGKSPRFLASKLGEITDKLDQILNRPVLNDDQITELANKLATVSDAAVIKRALIQVLTEGTNNAG